MTENTSETVEIDGLTLLKAGQTVSIHSRHGTPEGDLLEATNPQNGLPMNYALLQDGTLQDLRNENYSVVAPEDLAPEL